MTSSRSAGLPLTISSHVQGIAQAITEQVERKRRNDEEETREENEPPCHVVESRGLVEKASPRSGIRRHAETEIREGSFEKDVVGDQQRRVDDDRPDQVREDLAKDDPRVAGAQRS